MPHDKNNELLKTGDKVLVEFEVVSVLMGDEYCNVTLKIPGEHGPHNVTSNLSLNTHQVELKK